MEITEGQNDQEFIQSHRIFGFITTSAFGVTRNSDEKDS